MKAAGSFCSPAARQMVVICARSSELVVEARRTAGAANRRRRRGARWRCRSRLQGLGAGLKLERIPVDHGQDLGARQKRRQDDDHFNSPREPSPDAQKVTRSW